MIPYIDNNEYVTFFYKGRTHQLSVDNDYYDTLINILTKENDKIEEAIEYCNDPVLRRMGKKLGIEIDYETYQAFYNGERVENNALNYLFHLYQKKVGCKHIENFLTKLFKNPIKETITHLFDFVQLNQMPICEDGCFLAYKVVGANYKSLHDNKTPNFVGTNIEPVLEWSEIDTNRNSTCSNGYHFCSWKYIDSAFGGFERIKAREERLLILKIDPEMVGSIPYDYDGSKGRARTYFIESEYDVKSENNEDDFLTKKQDGIYVEKETKSGATQKFFNNRDSKGRFVKLK